MAAHVTRGPGLCHDAPVTASETAYAVSAERPEVLRHDLERIWRENLTLATSAEAKYRWLYEEAPDRADVVFAVRARAPDGAERVVGAKGIAVRRFWLAGRDAIASVSGDFAVDVPHRVLQPALLLARAAREHVQARFDLGYGFPNDKARGVMVRAGFRVVGRAARRVRVLRHAAYAAALAGRAGVPPWLARAAAHPLAARAIGAAADAARVPLDRARWARAWAGHRLEWCARPDARLDDLWVEARDAYPIVGARTARFLAWRYPAAPLAALVRRADGRLRAYAVVELDGAAGVAHLRDLFGHPADLPALVDLLLPALRARGARSVSVRFLGAPALARALEARGFVVRDEGRTVVVQPGDAAADRAAALADPARWHLFDADEDA
jgi:hypothetical protein